MSEQDIAERAAENIIKGWLWHTSAHDQGRAKTSIVRYIRAELQGCDKAQRAWRCAIETAKGAYVYGPSNISIERDAAIRARDIIIAALESAQQEEGGDVRQV